MPLYLTEEDVGRLLTMEACVLAVEDALRAWAERRAANHPRARAIVRGGTLQALAAASEALGRMAAKVYATTRAGSRFIVLLFDGRTSDLLAVVEADRLGQMRTGAASGVATRCLARRDARILGIIGTGWQARGQARGVAAVRRLEAIRAYGRDRERLAAFCREVEQTCGVTTIAAASPQEAVTGADIVVTATAAARPILQAPWIGAGTHINAVGSNRADRQELESDVVRAAGLVVVDSVEQARLEAGDLIAIPGTLERAIELSSVVAGRHPGRKDEGAITLFKSLGIGLEDLAAASLVYDLAVAAGAGRPI